MAIEIKNRYTGAVLKTVDAESLSGADLSGASLHGANLSCANLSYANLSRADLSYANLSYANLHGANLSCANLSCADLSGADLSGADLSGADLSGADLSYANLSYANLSYANLSYASLSYASLSGAKNIPAIVVERLTIVRDGILCIGWKKCKNNVIVKLEIPVHAKRSNGTERKCRASEAKVLEIFGADEGVSNYDDSFIYRKGEVVFPDSFNENRWNTCASGIHFFTTREEAEAY